LISPTQAVLLLKGLKDRTAPVRFTLVTAGARSAFEGVISEVSPAEVVALIPPSFRVSCALLVQLEGAKFEYGDTREAPASIRESLSEKFVSAITVLLRNGTRIVITELNPQGR
jgi:hypothetical protein